MADELALLRNEVDALRTNGRGACYAAHTWTYRHVKEN